MKYGGITGPYDPLYPEVTRMLRDSVPTYFARWLYWPLVSLFYVEEEWGDDPVWAFGIVRATKTEIANKAGVPRKSFDRGWKKLVEAGMVVEQEDGTFLLPYYKKKKYDAISAGEIRDKQRESDLRLARLEKLHPPDGENRGNSLENVPHSEEDLPHPEGDLPHPEGGPSFFKAFKRNSLSGNIIISAFYRGIGQKRISKLKRESALRTFRKLRTEKFSLEDIAFAVEWTLENVSEELYDFGIIAHTFGQAMAARERERKERSAGEERDKAEEEERARREAEDQERATLEAYKGALTIEERAELHDEAMAELERSGDYNPALISAPLINAQENDIIRKRLEEER